MKDFALSLYSGTSMHRFLGGWNKKTMDKGQSIPRIIVTINMEDLLIDIAKKVPLRGLSTGTKVYRVPLMYGYSSLKSRRGRGGTNN